MTQLHVDSDTSTLLHCPGFGWDRVNFLHNTWHGAAFGIQDEDNTDNTPMLSAVAEQCLHRVKVLEFTPEQMQNPES